MWRRGLPIAVVLATAAIAACTLELDHAIACGDGYVDERAGEECDPEKPSSYTGACEQIGKPLGSAGCDPTECTIIATSEQCAVCGDGVLDDSEECDGEDLGDATCPGGLPGLRCTKDCRLDDATCPMCGNGQRDEGEECDYNEVGGFIMPRRCAGTESTQPLPSPFPEFPYTFGETTTCLEGLCRFKRLACSYCGNGRVDEATLVDEIQGHYSLPEVCDGDLLPRAQLEAAKGPFCYEMADLNLRPNVGCAENCLGYEERPNEAPCCIIKGERCPAPTDPFQCCYGFDHPDEEPCQVVIDNQGLASEVCR